VLHRVHAENYDEPCILDFPDETLRVASVAARVRSWLDDGADAVMLQEVRGDVMAAVREAVTAAGLASGAVHAHRYPRVPSFKVATATTMTEMSEHLVIITADREATVLAAETFAGDPGKGFLAVRAGRVLYASTHVSYGALGAPQLAALASFVRSASSENSGGVAIVGGDFNAEAGVVASGLGADFALADLRDEPVTRPSATGSGATIDHVAALGVVCTSARVPTDESISDHRPIIAAFVI
jgi:endonuclease/exonuclease/phosphatase (EEP) superfamily protein YafD